MNFVGAPCSYTFVATIRQKVLALVDPEHGHFIGRRALPAATGHRPFGLAEDQPVLPSILDEIGQIDAKRCRSSPSAPAIIGL